MQIVNTGVKNPFLLVDDRVLDALDRVDCDAIIDCMASLTIRDLEVTTKERLRVRAALHKRSMEEEARSILRAAVAEDDAVKNLAEAIHERFRVLGGVELSLPEREPIRASAMPSSR